MEQIKRNEILFDSKRKQTNNNWTCYMEGVEAITNEEAHQEEEYSTQ